MVVIRGRLEPEVGALLMKALDAARERLYQRDRRQQPARRDDGAATEAPGPVGSAAATQDATLLRGLAPADPAVEPPTPAQQRANALALLAETALHHALDPGALGGALPGGGPRRCSGAGRSRA